MPILCGTDFSPAAAHAARAASCIARMRGDELCLVHVLDLPIALPPLAELELDSSAAQTELLRAAREHAGKRLADAAARAESAGTRVRTEVRVGYVDHALVELAAEISAACIVVAATGTRPSGLWKLGSHADRIAQTSPRPVLIVRDARPFEDWAGGERELRVVVALDRSPTAEAALRWALDFVAHSRHTLVGVHVYWPPDEARRAELARSASPREGGIARAIPLGKDHPEIDRQLAREFAPWLDAVPGSGDVELRFVGGLGRPADHLVELAGDESADLVVVGSHQRTGLSRFWNGSVSRGVIDLAPMSVACVPSSPERA